jgi:hypothetical protein
MTLLPTIAKVLLPALGVGAAQELAATAVRKITGNGLYLKKGGYICRIETDGRGIYLDSQVKGSGLKSYGDGLYLRRENGVERVTNGSGLLSNLTQNIPFLNLLF